MIKSTLILTVLLACIVASHSLPVTWPSNTNFILSFFFAKLPESIYSN